MYYETILNDYSNDWVMFIHGLGGSINTWKKQLEDFSKKFNLLLIDLDGHGKSECIESKNTYKPEENIIQINNILIKENIKKVNIVSLSLGTLVALEFALKYPQKVASNILAGCIINLDTKRMALLNFIQKVKKYMPKNVLYNLFAMVMLPKNNHKLSRKIFIRESKKMNKKSFIEWINSIDLSKFKLNDYIESINKNNIPTLFITGNEDYLFLKGIRKLKYRIKDFNLKIINHCGHVCSIEKAENFNNISLNFLEKEENS